MYEIMEQVIANDNDQSQGDNDGAASGIDLIRVVRETTANENSIDSQANAADDDQKAAESKSPVVDDLSLDSEETDDKSHDKRYGIVKQYQIKNFL